MSLYAEMTADLTGRNHDSRKVGHNTYLQRRGEEAVAIKFHETDVVTVTGDVVVITTGGWKTVTTKLRINEFLQGFHWNLFSDRGTWMLSDYRDPNDRKLYVYKDGVTFRRIGLVLEVDESTVGSPQVRKGEAKLKKLVREYAKLCVSQMPLEMPSGGDCWFCAMFEKAERNTLPAHGKPEPGDHIFEHMRTKYVVPSLVWNALIYSGCDPQGSGSFWFNVAFNPQWTRDVGDRGDHTRIETYVYRYICRYFGLAV